MSEASDGWYATHPEHGVRCSPFTLAPFVKREDAETYCRERENELRAAIAAFYRALKDYAY